MAVGAGQTGLQVAARMHQLGLKTLTLEKSARVGDVWRVRYRTLALHTPSSQHSRASFSLIFGSILPILDPSSPPSYVFYPS